MNILITTGVKYGLPGDGHNHWELERALSTHTNVSWTRRPMGIRKAIQHVMPAADIVLTTRVKPRNAKYKAVGYIDDMIMVDKGIFTQEDLVKHVKLSRWDAVIVKYLECHGTDEHPRHFVDNVDAKVIWTPWSVDQRRFQPEHKNIDVASLCTVKDAYPLRNAIQTRFHKVTRNLSTIYTKDMKHYIGPHYVKMLAWSRAAVFGCPKHRYAVRRYFEAASSGCVIMADSPAQARKLGFVDGWTMVEVTENNWDQVLLSHLDNPRQLERIARNARELVMDKHTHTHRALELYSALRKL